MQDAINTWQDVQREVLGRIQNRVWKPGDIIPNEVDLAKEFGCARATVNRALQAVADSGLLDRRRKAGTPGCRKPGSQGNAGNSHHSSGNRAAGPALSICAD